MILSRQVPVTRIVSPGTAAVKAAVIVSPWVQSTFLIAVRAGVGAAKTASPRNAFRMNPAMWRLVFSDVLMALQLVAPNVSRLNFGALRNRDPASYPDQAVDNDRQP